MDQFSSAEWSRKSWIDAANRPDCGFPLQSLPYCVFSIEGESPRIGVGIGGSILDLRKCNESGLLDAMQDEIRSACCAPTLNALMACGSVAHGALRRQLMSLLDDSADAAIRERISAAFEAMERVTLVRPVDSANYTDFYASIHHATRVGKLFRPDQPLLPNYKHVPIGYHGRASSLVVSGTPVRRPKGQTKPVGNSAPAFGATRFLDYEVEIGMYVAQGNVLGEAIPVGHAGDHIFGLSLVDDWSARDVQSWEYQPLGPFLAKSFATSVSPWVVPMAALAPFRVPVLPRSADDPKPLPYLYDQADQMRGALDITVEAWLLTAAMRAAGLGPHLLSRANMRDLYWSPAQLIAHHASNGCNLLPGDLVATGTISGAEDETAGCLLELTESGKKTIVLPNGEKRTALEDGDEVILRGFCRRDGLPLISLGECRGLVLSAN